MNGDYTLSAFATAALEALRAARMFLRAQVTRTIEDNCLCDPATGIFDRATLDELAVSDVARQEALLEKLTNAILESGPGAADIIALDDKAASDKQKQAEAARRGGIFSHNAHEYGVTVTADVTATRPDKAARAFIESLGIQNADGLTFNVEHLQTGQKWEFDEA
jgi:hypothetical protein